MIEKRHQIFGTLNLTSKRPITVLAIPDTHFPYHHPDMFRFLREIEKEHKPDLIIHQGDEFEFAGLSFHEHDPQMPSAKDEYEAGLECIGQLYKMFPEVLVCMSNHTSRPFRVAFKAGLPSQMVKSYRDLLKAPPGWSWHERILVNNVCYIHGDPKSGRNAAHAWMVENRMSTSIGHIHGHAGVGYSQNPFNQTFHMNTGCLIDLEALSFKYGAKYANKGTLGCGIVKSSKEAFFIPMK